jgi:PAS domain S-box-containing protein
MKDWGWVAAVHPDDLNSLADAWQRVRASEQAGEAEARLRRFDGVYRWFLFRVSPLRNDSGKVVRWYGANTDIQAHKEAAEELQRAIEASEESERDLRLMIETIPGLAWCAAPNGELNYLNRRLLEYTGATLTDWSKGEWAKFLHPNDVESVVSAWWSALSSGKMNELQCRLRRYDGVFRWFQMFGQAALDGQGAVIRWYGLLLDVDDRKRAEDALKASERNLSITINAIPAIIAALRTDGSIVYGNEAFSDYTGVSPGDMQKEDFRSRVFHPEDVERLREERRAALTRGVPFENEQRALGKDGRYRWFLIRYSPVLDELGRIDRWYAAGFEIDDRKKAEGERKKAYLQLTEAQRLSKTGSFISDILADEHSVSEEFLRIFDFDPEARVNLQMVRDIVHPEDRSAFDDMVARATSGMVIDTVYRVVTSRGVVKHVLSRVRLMEQVDGRPILCGAIQDVTESKIAEDALRASERNLNLIINAIPAVIGVMRADGTPLYGNQAVTDYTGFTAEDMLKDDFRSRLFHPEDLEELREVRRQAFARGMPFENEMRSLGKDGRYRWFLFRYKPQFDEAGNIDRWYMTAFDIENRKRAEAELRRAYNSFADAQELSKTGSFITDLMGDDHNWSEEAYRIFGFDVGSKVTVQRIGDVIHPDDLQPFQTMIARAMTGVHVNFAFRIVTARGGLKHVRGVAHVMERVEGRPMFVGALQDVTETKLAEEALDKTRSELAHVARVAALSALTASIAHEVNQPLAGIITNAGTCLRMLNGNPPNIDGARETARRTIRDGNRASDVITRLRALYSKKEFTLEALDLNEATQEVIALSLSDLQRSQVVLRSELSEGLPLVTGDRVQLQQVILNLLRNASDAMVQIEDRPKELLIKTERDDGEVRLSVKDAGVGFGPEAADKLFQAFYTTKDHGMGIGLSVSRSIIEAHRGRLWAMANDGPGATFSFSIPCASESLQAEGT